MKNCWKKLFAGLAVCTLLASCGNSSDDIYSRPMEEYAKGELSVAYVNYGNTNYGFDRYLNELTSAYRDLKLNRETYASWDEFNTSVTTQLNAGDGPDLFLLNYASQLSFQKMAASGIYKDLTPYIGADPRLEEAAFYGLDAGKRGSSQYLLPLSVSNFGLYTTKENLSKMGITLDDSASCEEILTILEVAVAQYQNDSSIIPVVPLISRNDLAAFFLDAFHIPVVDWDQKEVILDKDLYQRIAELARQWYEAGFGDAFNQRDTILKDSENAKNALLAISNIDGFGWDYYNYQAIMKSLGQESLRIPFPSYGTDGQVAGMLYTYGAVNSYSDNAILAYETLRAMMDYPLSVYNDLIPVFSGATPAQKQLHQNFLLKIDTVGLTIELDGKQLPLQSQKAVNDQLLNQPMDIQTNDSNLNGIIKETMSDYISGVTDDFDTCWDNMVNRLNLYLNE